MEYNVKVGFVEQRDHFMKKPDTWCTAILKGCMLEKFQKIAIKRLSNNTKQAVYVAYTSW